MVNWAVSTTKRYKVYTNPQHGMFACIISHTLSSFPSVMSTTILPLLFLPVLPILCISLNMNNSDHMSNILQSDHMSNITRQCKLISIKLKYYSTYVTHNYEKWISCLHTELQMMMWYDYSSHTIMHKVWCYNVNNHYTYQISTLHTLPRICTHDTVYTESSKLSRFMNYACYCGRFLHDTLWLTDHKNNLPHGVSQYHHGLLTLLESCERQSKLSGQRLLCQDLPLQHMLPQECCSLHHETLPPPGHHNTTNTHALNIDLLNIRNI